MIYIDVRTKGEYENGHKESAINFDIQNIMQGKFPDISKDEEVVLYCQSGSRSGMAKTLMEQNGFTNVINGGSLADVSQLN